MSKTEMVKVRKHALPSIVLYGLAGTLIFVGVLLVTRINRMVWFNIIDRRAVAYIHNCLCLLADQKSHCNCYLWWCFDTYRNIYDAKETDNSMSVMEYLLCMLYGQTCCRELNITYLYNITNLTGVAIDNV